ncbi:MAG TPA: zf-HC2 domain-containing protein [Acidimicrobiia bacterium]|jgi:hypothetical protein
MTWHPSVDAISAYAINRLPSSQAWSIEAHVAGCDPCRRGAAYLPGPARLEAIWEATLEQVDAPRRSVVEKALGAVGVPEHLARLLAATPSLTVPWLAAVTVVLGLGLAMAWSSAGDPAPSARSGLFPFLLLAPLVPLAGVAVAFGPVVDPAYEVAVASPFHGFRLLLIRTVAVVATSTTVALALALLLPNAGVMAAAWILPSLALASAALAASTFVSPLVAAGGCALVWLVGVTVIEVGPRTLVAFGRTGQLLFAVALATAVILVVLRRESFEIGRRR